MNRMGRDTHAKFVQVGQAVDLWLAYLTDAPFANQPLYLETQTHALFENVPAAILLAVLDERNRV